MKIVIVGDNHFNSIPSSLKRALIALGHDVYHFDYLKEAFSEFFNIRFIKRRVLSPVFTLRMNICLLSYIKVTKPDLVLVCKGELISKSTLLKIKKYGCFLVNWNPDSPFEPVNSSKELLKSIAVYDVYFTWSRFLMQQISAAGAKSVKYLPFAYDPFLHYPITVDGNQTKYYGSDVVFVGTWDPERVRWLEPISELGLKIWGNSWHNLAKASPLRKNWHSKAVYGIEVSKIYNASGIVLNFLRKQNVNSHNMRTFEVPACKGFLLTTRSAEQCEYFEENKEIACFSTIEELIDKLNYFLVHKEEAKKYAELAYKRLINNNHTYKDRTKQILSLCY
jgi:spore maturation protein CgeB